MKTENILMTIFIFVVIILSYLVYRLFDYEIRHPELRECRESRNQVSQIKKILDI